MGMRKIIKRFLPKRKQSFLRFKNKKGFTIIELMVVLVILGTLMTVLFVSLSDSGIDEEKAKFKMKADRAKIEAALFRFKNDVGRLPTEDEGLEVLVNCSPDIDSSRCKKWLSSEDALLDPWQHPYIFRVNENGGYDIISLGADGAEGGEGQNADINLKELK